MSLLGLGEYSVTKPQEVCKRFVTIYECSWHCQTASPGLAAATTLAGILSRSVRGAISDDRPYRNNQTSENSAALKSGSRPQVGLRNVLPVFAELSERLL